MKKTVAFFMAIMMTLTLFCAPCYAASSTATYSLGELYCVCYDANGNLVPQTRTAISTNTIPAYGTMQYYMPSGSYFPWTAGASVRVSLVLSRAASTQIGYKSASGSNVLFSSSYTSTPAKTFTIAYSGNYSVLVKNNSSSPLTINYGTISY